MTRPVIARPIRLTEVVFRPRMPIVWRPTEQADFTYDNEGNLILAVERGTNQRTEYEYDHRNRLTSVTIRDSEGVVTSRAEYEYDALDRRIAKTVDPDGDLDEGEETFKRSYLYTDDDVLIEWLDSDVSDATPTAIDSTYLMGPGSDQLLAWETADDVYWALSDHQGSVREVTSPSGLVVDSVVLSSFGQILDRTDPEIPLRYFFTGREYDSETGFYFYRARYYDPQVGRFISMDPLSFAAGDSNLYRYVGNHPTSATDPTGMQESGIAVSQGVVSSNERFTGKLNELRDPTPWEVFKAGVYEDAKTLGMARVGRGLKTIGTEFSLGIQEAYHDYWSMAYQGLNSSAQGDGIGSGLARGILSIDPVRETLVGFDDIAHRMWQDPESVGHRHSAFRTRALDLASQGKDWQILGDGVMIAGLALVSVAYRPWRSPSVLLTLRKPPTTRT